MFPAGQGAAMDFKIAAGSRKKFAAKVHDFPNDSVLGKAKQRRCIIRDNGGLLHHPPLRTTLPGAQSRPEVVIRRRGRGKARGIQDAAAKTGVSRFWSG